MRPRIIWNLLAPNQARRIYSLVALLSIGGGLLGTSPVLSAATIDVSDSAGLQSALDNAQSGDDIELQAGTYPGRFVLSDRTGITISSQDPANPATIDAAGLGEALKFSAVHNVSVTGINIENASVNGINIDDVGTAGTDTSTGITLQNLTFTNGSGNGIKLAGVDNFYVGRINMVGWGGGDSAVDLVGSHHGLVECSYFQNSSPGSGTGFQAKGGSADVIVRANRFVTANERAIQIGGSTDLDVFRPQPPGNVEASGIVAEGNVILNNGYPSAGIGAAVSFVNTADGIFRNNVVDRPSIYAIRILKENTQPGFIDTQNGTIVNNDFIWNEGDLAEAVNVGDGTLPNTFHFAGNHWYNSTNPANSTPSLPTTETGGVYGVDPQVNLRGITPWDYPWGKWVVNTSDLLDTITLDHPEKFKLAIPGPGATLDLSAANPLIGAWQFEALTSANFSVQPFSYSVLVNAMPFMLGDFNGDGHVTAADITVMLNFLTDENAYKSSLNLTDDQLLLIGDLNGDGKVDNADLQSLLALLKSGGGSISTVPEPTSVSMFVLGGVLLAIFGQRVKSSSVGKKRVGQTTGPRSKIKKNSNPHFAARRVRN